MQNAELNTTVAIFTDSGHRHVILVCLEDDPENATADAAASGYEYAGCIAVRNGVPQVLIEPGFAAIIARAGIIFAERLGPLVKDFQLRQQALALAAEERH